MPGVMAALIAETKAECLGAESREGKGLRVASGAWFSSAGCAACCVCWRWRAPRHLDGVSRPNKRMHATADTMDVKFLQWRGAARDARRSAARVL
jgi:hypothetical protein